MPVHKRTPGLDADDYYVAGSTVRRSAHQAEEPMTRRAPDRNRDRQRLRHEELVRDTRSRQERRRAEPTRAYYEPEPATQRLTHAEVNHRTVQQHAWQRAEAERRRREEEARERAEIEAEEVRRRQHRIQALFAAVGIVVVVAVAAGVYTLLLRYVQLENMVVEQRSLIASIEDQQKRLEELQVEINMQGNISKIQEYARENLHMDYAKKEDTRVINLP
ncbi:MAG: cell division protein FtsL [Candidatus Spyradocola sp.]|jgi:cell division protein FtsL